MNSRDPDSGVSSDLVNSFLHNNAYSWHLFFTSSFSLLPIYLSCDNTIRNLFYLLPDYWTGNRWKAQLQLRQVSYYAGTYDSELEAAREFDKRARKEGAGSDFKYNFDENGMSFDYQNLCTEKKEKKHHILS